MDEKQFNKVFDKEVEKLKELRKTLINDIVTGKICIVEKGGSGVLVRPASEQG